MAILEIDLRPGVSVRGRSYSASVVFRKPDRRDLLSRADNGKRIFDVSSAGAATRTFPDV